MKMLKLAATLPAAAGLLLLGATGVSAQKSTLEIVKERGHLRCQVGTPSPGFYNLDANGEWYGMDVAVCRAIAAAVVGDAKKVEFQSVSTQARFTAMANGESDVLSRTTTWTLLRDTQLGLDFTAVNMYDGQGFMVLKDSGIKSALELKGATVCVLTGTTTELNLADFNRVNNLNIKPVTFEDNNVRDDTFANGGCDAITNDKSSLASTRAKFPNPGDFVVLPETISKEPLGPVVRRGDNEWFAIVKWVVFATINAEEMGVTSENVDEMKKSTNPNIRRLLGVSDQMGEKLGISNDWAYNIVKQVGNYGEIFERNVGAKSPLKLERGINALWTDGGLMYGMPVR